MISMKWLRSYTAKPSAPVDEILRFLWIWREQSYWREQRTTGQDQLLHAAQRAAYERVIEAIQYEKDNA
jgi:hypothetical protein